MISVSIVTGFLGSGKTTLIGRILRDPTFARTAVIVNEFGEIGLDHDLIAHSDETLLALTTGCLCCAVRGDLVATLLDLQERRDAGEIAYDQVLIETSGLADPAPILQALMTDPDIGRGHALDTVLTVVDALLAATTLDRYPEARRQVVLADLLAISKIDAVSKTGGGGEVAALSHRLAAMNPGAAQATTADLVPGLLFAGAEPLARAARLAALAPDVGSPFLRAQHSDGVETFALRRDRPVPALALTLFLQALVEHCGGRLLRVKGLMNIAEMPGQPALIHGVQHVFSPPEFLAEWPSPDRRTRLVFIARGVPRHFAARLLDSIESEVRDAQAVDAADHA